VSSLHKRKRINHTNNKLTNLSEQRRKKNVFPSYLKIFDIRDIREAYIVFVRRLKERDDMGQRGILQWISRVRREDVEWTCLNQDQRGSL
jgi:hypothetical protein